jgi:cell division protein FtsN
MARPRRGVKAAPRKRKRRLGAVLFFAGLLAVLGGTFAAGALAGRLSLRPSPSVANVARGTERAAKPGPPPPPTLTFYRELTAPLTAPPPPPKPARAEPKLETPPGEAARHAEAPADAPAGPPRAEAGGYTVQVGSYNVRAQAEGLAARLAAGGHDAYVAEGEAGGVTRYRVRVGAFATREEAREAAVRLGSDARVATYVTTR